jgi:outer membrane PBP1 activator LpoA protein
MRLRLILLLLLPLFLIGCASVSSTSTPSTTAYGDFEKAGELAEELRDLSMNERTGTSRNIERLLAGVPSNELSSKSARLSAGDPLYPFAAHELRKRGLPLPRALNNGATARTDNFPPADSDGYRPPNQLAVLLPITGNLATPAASVRDGILAGYFAENRRRPAIKVYDTAGTADGVQRAATQAVADGAQMILGPLTRDEVGAIFSQTDLGVPVIALNHGPTPPTPGNASFSLSPEEEGFVAADHLADRHVLKVFAVSQHDDTAQRTLAAFREQLRKRGGDIVAELSVDGSTMDASAIPQALAKATAPPDGIFLALRAAPARLVAAQISTSSISSLPRISSSLILSGGGNSRLDSLFDGIELPALPWLLDQRPLLPIPDSLAKSMPSARGAAQSLFAFGMDAWKLAAYYDRLSSDPAFSISGATGVLRLDSYGTVQREPTWAVFSGGRPRAVAPSN